MRSRALILIGFLGLGLVFVQEAYAIPALGNPLNAGSNYIYNVQGLSVGTSATSSGQIVIGAGGSIKFPDSSTQTTAYLGSTQIINAGYVTSGTFGYPNYTGNYGFMSSSTNSTAAFYVKDLSANTVLDVDTTNQRVGIGTAGPGAALDVSGYIRTGNFGTNFSAIAIDAATGFYPYSTSALWATPFIYRSMRNPDNGSGSFPWNNYGELILQGTSYGSYNRGISFVTTPDDSTTSTIRLRIDPNGNVGIGTASPGATLSVVKAGAVALTVGRDTNAGSNAMIQINYTNASDQALAFRNTNTGGRIWSIGDGVGVNAGYFGIYDQTAPATRLAIDTSGNVGIGTTAPDRRLVIDGGNAVSDAYVSTQISTTSASYASGLLMRVSNGAGGYTNYGWVRMNGDSGGRVDLGANSANVMSLTTGGNVGINSTQPGDKLEVNNGGIDNSGLTLSEYRSGYSYPAITFRESDDTYTNGLLARIIGQADNGSLNTSRRGTIYFQNKLSGTALGTLSTTMVIDGVSGYVGIATTTPGSTLTVSGNGLITGNLTVNGTISGSLAGSVVVNASNVTAGTFGYPNYTGSYGFMSSSTNSTAAFYVKDLSANTVLDVDTTNQRVGIGTAAPATKLDVSGDISLSGKITSETSNGAAALLNGGLLNLVQNGSFEDGISPWTAVGGASSVTQSSDFAYQGTYSAKTVTPGIAANEGMNWGITLSSGKTYTASFYIRTSIGTATINGLDQAGLGGDYQWGPTMTITTSWQRYTHTFTAGATNSNYRVHTASAQATTFYVDYFKMEEGTVATGFTPLAYSQTTGAVFTTGNVGIGISTPKLPLHVYGTVGAPATSGITPSGVAVIADNYNNNLYMGSYSASPYGFWLQAQDSTNLATNYPLILNPNGGSVGIGTTGPQSTSKLQIYGTLKVGGNSGTQTLGVIALGDDLNTLANVGIFRGTSAGLSDNGNVLLLGGYSGVGITTGNTVLGSQGTPRVFVDTSGNVGIGTTGPGATLDVQRTASDGATILNINGGASASGYRIVAQNNGSNVFRVTQTGDVLIDANDNNTGLVVTKTSGYAATFSGGNVGIATTTPAYPLTVNGVIYSTTGGVRFPDNTTQTTAYQGSTQTISAAYVTSGTFGYPNYTGNYGFMSSSTNSTGFFQVKDLSANVVLDVDTTNQRVGIGTASPGQLLTVGNGTMAGGYLAGIGTANTGGAYVQASNGTNTTFIGADSTANGQSMIGSLTNNNLALRTNNTVRVTIDTSGNVGIGTTGPNAKLEVSGSGVGNPSTIKITNTGGKTWQLGEVVNVGNFDIYDTAVGSRFTIASSTGNVGIGTTNPQSALDIENGGLTIFSTPQTGHWNSRIPINNSLGSALAAEPAPSATNNASIAIGTDGLPVISFTNLNLNLLVAHCGNASCSSGNTVTTVVSGSNNSYNTAITIGTDGLPIIAYSAGNNNVSVIHCGNASCSSGNTTTLIDSGIDGWYTSITIGTDGLPVISYSVYVTTGIFPLKVVHCGNVSCSSGNTVTTIEPNTQVTGTAIAIGTDGLPGIAYIATAGGNTLLFAHCGNVSCSSGNTTSSIGSATAAAYAISMTIGTDSFPVISYASNVNGYLLVAKCGNASCSSGNTITTVDSTTNVGMQSNIAIGADGLPVIAYGGANFVKCGNNACSSGNGIVSSVVSALWGSSAWTPIAIGSDGLPVIAYTNGSYNFTVVKCGSDRCIPYWTRR